MSLAERMPPAGLNPTLCPVRVWYSRIARHMTSETGRVAFVGSLPVEVLMKSDPAIMHTSEHWYTTVHVGSSPTARMPSCAPARASRKSHTSRYSPSQSARSALSRGMTMSISIAPSATQPRISASLCSCAICPEGSPSPPTPPGSPSP